jgi:hypothetical protein
MNMIKKFFPIVVFLLCCSEILLLHAQYTPSQQIQEEDSYKGENFLADESLVSYQIESPFDNENSTLINLLAEGDCPSGYIWDSDLGECLIDIDMPGNPDPGHLPIDNAYGFCLLTALLYGLKCFHNRRKSIKTV